MPLNFISAGAAQGLVGAVAREGGIQIAGSFGAVGAMLEKFRAGEPCDVVILTDVQIADLVATAEVRAETPTDLGVVPTSIAVRAADASPDVSSESALRAALLAADAIYFPDPAKATAGIHFAGVLEKLGIRGELAGRLRTFPNGATAMREMAGAPGRPIGCTQSTEILATADVRLVAPLPPGFDLATVYTAAVGARASNGSDAARFVERLGSPEMLATRVAAGFQGHAIRPARASDHDTVREIVGKVLAEYSLSCSPADTDRDLRDIDASYSARGGAFDVVVAPDGRIVGCCGVYAIDPGTCELRKMYLLREARGLGLGRRLLRRALAFARGRGYRRVELETASVLEDAIALYSRAGFKPIERTHLASRCDQAYALEINGVRLHSI